MSKLTWDNKEYLFGVEQCAIYPSVQAPYPWNGVVSIEESSDPTLETIFVEGTPVTKETNPGVFYAQIEAVSLPEPHTELVNIAYKTLKPEGYILHLVYNVFFDGVSVEYSTITDTLDFLTIGVTTSPILSPGLNAYSHVMIDSVMTRNVVLQTIENTLYGTENTSPRFMMLDEIIALYDLHSVMTILNNGDGTWTANGPAGMVDILDATTFQVVAPSVIYSSDNTYVLSSW